MQEASYSCIMRGTRWNFQIPFLNIITRLEYILKYLDIISFTILTKDVLIIPDIDVHYKHMHKYVHSFVDLSFLLSRCVISVSCPYT